MSGMLTQQRVLIKPLYPHQQTAMKLAVARILGLGTSQRAVVLSVRESFRSLKRITNDTMYEAFRGDWTADFNLHRPNLAVCHVSGVVIRVYHIHYWEQAEPGRTRFDGDEADAWRDLIGRNIGAQVNRRGQANPVLFVNC